MMRIVSQVAAQEIAEALNLFPESLRRLLKFDVFEGDPVFANVACYDNIAPTLNRSPRNTAHVLYPWRGWDKKTTIVLPKPIGVESTVHELAHVLDLALDFDVNVHPVTWYAQTNRAEAFAEFVTAVLVPGYLPWDPKGQEYVAPQQWALAALEAA